MAYKNFATAEYTPTEDVGPAGTVPLPYPAGTTKESFEGADPELAVLIINNSNRYQGSDYVTFAFGDTEITASNAADAAWPKDLPLLFQIPKVPLFEDAASSVAKSDAVISAGMAITPVGTVVADQAGVDALAAKIDELVAAYQANPA